MSALIVILKAAACLGFGLRWAAGADAGGGGGGGQKSSLALWGPLRLARIFLGGKGVVPGWGLEVEECWGSFEG